MIFRGFGWEGPRDLSSVKGHAVCGIEELTFFCWNSGETCVTGDENCDRYADTIWLIGLRQGWRISAQQRRGSTPTVMEDS